MEEEKNEGRKVRNQNSRKMRREGRREARKGRS